jgi:hypothetical protein
VLWRVSIFANCRSNIGTWQFDLDRHSSGESDADCGLWCRASDYAWQRAAGARLAVSADVADDQHRSGTACGRAAASVGVTGTTGTTGTITAISDTERKYWRPDRSA